MSIASLYPSINPSLLLDFANSKVLDPRITFTRTTTATYYDGVTTAKAEENLFLYSQQMDNASGWATNGITVTADNASAPDGTTTAELLTATSGTSGKLIQNGTLSPASSTAYTFSFFIKAGTHNFIQFMNANDAQAYANFNASTGALGNYGSNTTATITSVGNSWYRCVLTFSSAATLNSSFRWYMVASNTAAWASSLAAAGTETMYIWGAQAEQRSSATAYTATTTQAITNYIPVLQTAAAGQARFDHNPTTGESLGLLIEEARTNLLTYSQQLTLWNNASSAVVVDNAVVSPDGTIDASTFTDTTASSQHYMTKNATVVSGTSYTFSVYVKSYQLQGIALRIITATTVAQSYFNLSAGTITVSAGTATITNVGNGWYRCTLTGIADSTTAAVYINLLQTPSSTTLSYSGTGTGLFIWGAQLEAGSFATSYIPTVASSVTRNADAASMTGTNFSSWWNQNEGTFYSESSTVLVSGKYPGIYKTGTSNADRFGVFLNGSSGSLAFYRNAQGVSSATNASSNTMFKYSASYSTSSINSAINAGAVTTTTITTVANTPTQILIGQFDEYMSGTIKKIAYYPIRVTNTQLQSLTV